MFNIVTVHDRHSLKP